MSSTNQKIGLIGLTALVIGNLIGSGVFLLPATLASFGSISLMGWVVSSFGAIILALVFANLSQLMPKSGGPYVYAQEAFGKDVGFYVCWAYWVMCWISNASLIAGAIGYMSQIYGSYNKELALIVELSLLFLMTAINLYGVKVTNALEVTLTIAKVIPLLMLPIAGLMFVNMDNFNVFNATGQSTISTLNLVAFTTFWGFVGLETGTVPGGNVKNPKRNIPIATILGTVIAASIYILGTFVIMGVLDREALIISKAPYADAANAIWGGSWGTPVAIAAIIACIGSLNGWIMIVGKMPQAAAEDKLFPKIFAKTSQNGAPFYGIIASSLLTVPLIVMSISDKLIEQFYFIMEISVTLILIIYAISTLAFIKILYLKQKLYSLKGGIAFVALSFSLWAIWGASIKMAALSLIFVACGIPLHMYMKFKKNA